MVTYRITTQIVIDGALGELVDIVEMESDRTPETAGCFTLVNDYNEVQATHANCTDEKCLAGGGCILS